MGEETPENLALPRKRRRTRLERLTQALAPLLLVMTAGVLSMGVVRVVEHVSRPSSPDRPWEPEMPNHVPFDVVQVPSDPEELANGELGPDGYWKPEPFEPEFDFTPERMLPATGGIEDAALEPAFDQSVLGTDPLAHGLDVPAGEAESVASAGKPARGADAPIR